MMNKTTRRLMVVTAAAFGALVVSQGTAAAQATDNLAVQATVVANCNINAPNVLQFGNYDPIVVNAAGGADLDGSTTIEVRCTKNSANVWIGLDLGANASGSTRRMTDGTEFLTYEIYQDAPGGTVWGNVLGEGVSYTAATSAWVDVDVFGRVPQGQDVSAGTYNDTVVATINF
jgi:spore coat protein U-like protein